MPELYDLITTYKPQYLYADAAHGPVTYWGSREFLSWLYNERYVSITTLLSKLYFILSTCLKAGASGNGT